MSEQQENCTLTCDGEEVAMKSVHVHGKLDGLLLRMKVRQTYTNDTNQLSKPSTPFHWPGAPPC
jgi:hypothetical protein